MHLFLVHLYKHIEEICSKQYNENLEVMHSGSLG
jgi:hypothetical protein